MYNQTVARPHKVCKLLQHLKQSSTNYHVYNFSFRHTKYHSNKNHWHIALWMCLWHEAKASASNFNTTSIVEGQDEIENVVQHVQLF